MILYLDLNCFNRPFDDQNQARIAIETESVLSTLKRIEAGIDQLVWSAVLTFENSRHPLHDRRDKISAWRETACSFVDTTDLVAKRAAHLVTLGFHALDSVHIASAEAGQCDRFITCDDRLLKRAKRVELSVLVLNPVEYAEEVSLG